MGKVVIPFLRSAYNYDRNEAGDESGLKCEDESLAKQSFAEECDINTIVNRFKISGELPSDVRAPTYDDYHGIFDFHSAMNAIAQANESFDQLPASVRARFQNDPAEFVEFCSVEENRAEAERLGLVFDKPMPAPVNDYGPEVVPESVKAKPEGSPKGKEAPPGGKGDAQSIT